MMRRKNLAKIIICLICVVLLTGCGGLRSAGSDMEDKADKADPLAQCHESWIPLTTIGPIMVEMAKKATVPVCVHLDHGEPVFFSSIFMEARKAMKENVKSAMKVFAGLE